MPAPGTIRDSRGVRMAKSHGRPVHVPLGALLSEAPWRSPRWEEGLAAATERWTVR